MRVCDGDDFGFFFLQAAGLFFFFLSKRRGCVHMMETRGSPRFSMGVFEACY